MKQGGREVRERRKEKRKDNTETLEGAEPEQEHRPLAFAQGKQEGLRYLAERLQGWKSALRGCKGVC